MKKITFLFFLASFISWSSSELSLDSNEIEELNSGTCNGTSTATLQGSLTNGYNYEFETNGTDVTITFEILDVFVGQIVQLRQGNDFTTMSNPATNTWVITLNSQNPNDVLTFSFYGPNAEQLWETVQYSYTVGDDCGDLASLSDLKIDGETIEGFEPTKDTYEIDVELGSSVPQITTVSPTDLDATVGTITQAGSLPGSASFDVTSPDNSVTVSYTVNFNVFQAGAELIGNGGFESGDFTDWENIESTPGQQTVSSTNPSSGTFSANLNNTVLASSSVLKSGNRGVGIVSANDEVIIRFDARGSGDVGGVFIAELLSEVSPEGTSKTEILGGGPLPLNADPNVWTSFEFTATVGPDVSGGLTLQFVAATGGGPGSESIAWVDNVSMFTKDEVLSTEEVLVATAITATPNPTTNVWNISVAGNEQISSAIVYDLLGKEVIKLEPNTDQVTLEASNLKSGLYLARIYTNEGTKTIKLVKE